MGTLIIKKINEDGWQEPELSLEIKDGAVTLEVRGVCRSEFDNFTATVSIPLSRDDLEKIYSWIVRNLTLVEK
jgi:hypothetical protein